MLREGPTNRPVLHFSTLESRRLPLKGKVGDRVEQRVKVRYKEDGSWGCQSPPPICSKRQPRGLLSQQTEPRRSQMTEGTVRKWCDSGLKTQKETVGIRESLLTTPWDPHPPPSILLPDASRILRAYPSPGLSQTRLVEFFSGEPEWTHILTFEKTSCCFITWKKHQQLTGLSTCTEIQIWFFVILLLICSNSQGWANLYRKPMKWKVEPKHREGKKPGENMQTLQGV